MTNDIKQRIEKIKNGRVPEGYSHTKIGIFPDDWSVVSFDIKFNRLDRKNDEDNQNVLTISAQHGLISQQDYYNSSYASENKKGYSMLYKGDFSYNKSYSGDYLYGAIKRLDKYDKGIVSPLYICFEPKEGTNSEFYLQYFEAGLFNGEIYKIAQEGARNHGLLNVSVTDFFKMHLVNPPTEEQQKIAEILMQCDKVIELYEKEIDELQKLKKIYLKKMFPQKGTNVPELRFVEFTEPWKECKLGDIVEFLDNMRKPLKESDRTKGIYPYYGASGIVDHINDYLFDEELILLSEDGANITDRNSPVCFLASGKYWVNNHAHVMKATEKNENNFICISLERMDFTPYNSGMAMPKLNKEICQKIVLLCPSFDEQKKIGDYFRNLDSLITLNQRKLEEKKKYKKSLMQLLLTGIVRVQA